MDKLSITPSRLKGTVKIPPSKSSAHRALICGFLSGKACRIDGITTSDDMKATMSCIKGMGGDFLFDEISASVTFSERHNLPDSSPVVLNCRESGSTLRFFIPIALALGVSAEFHGHGRLMERPLDPYFNIFHRKGISYSIKDNVLSVSGKLSPDTFTVDGNISSQFITGLLFALPLLDGDSKIIITGGLKSRGYVDITIDVLKKFGIEIYNNNYEIISVKGNQKYKNIDYSVEGDFSQAAFFLVAGALGCDINCMGLSENSLQGDKKIINIIESIGGIIERDNHSGICAKRTANMRGITVDAEEIPDLVPVLAVLLCFCEGESKIINAGRLRLKESDRLAAITCELSKVGADITEGPDYLIIQGKQALCGAEVSSWNDHRIAMTMAIAACRCERELCIYDAVKSLKKSYPHYFEDYKALGGIVK